MERVIRVRRQERRHALRGLGVNGDFPRLFVGEVYATGREALILALPFLGGTASVDDQPLQDPVTGEPLFMWSVSEFGGSEPHA